MPNKGNQYSLNYRVCFGDPVHERVLRTKTWSCANLVTPVPGFENRVFHLVLGPGHRLEQLAPSVEIDAGPGKRISMEIPGYRGSLLLVLKYSNMSTRTVEVGNMLFREESNREETKNL